MFAVRDLGVYFFTDPNWPFHCSVLARRAVGIANCILRSLQFDCVSHFRKAFVSYCRPILEHCSPVWSPYNVADVLRIECSEVLKTHSHWKFQKGWGPDWVDHSSCIMDRILTRLRIMSKETFLTSLWDCNFGLLAELREKNRTTLIRLRGNRPSFSEIVLCQPSILCILILTTFWSSFSIQPNLIVFRLKILAVCFFFLILASIFIFVY